MSEQARCEGRRNDGGPCRSFALPGRPFCYAHDPERAAERQAARAKGSQNAGKLRMLRGKRTKLNTVADLIRFTAGVIHDVREAHLPPDVGRCVLYGLSIQRQLLEVGDLERRIAALEGKAEQGVRQ